jgi:GcrA cell cycle regulator
MQSTNWANEHSDALLEYLAKGMSYSAIAKAINARFKPEFVPPTPRSERPETARLRCVEIDPRHLSLADLEPGDCRYPFGGEEEGEAITFCGHPRQQGSSYCTSHFHLTRGPGTASERSAGTVLLRLVEAA